MTAAICIGTSAGGIAAIQKLLHSLPQEFKVPIVVTQHIASDAEFDLPLVFGRNFPNGLVLEAIDKMPLGKRSVYFAPPGYHLSIERDLSLSLSQEEPVHFARPSIDVFFESAAWALAEKGVGILLTGANADGAQGLLKMKQAGAVTIAQDPSEAEFRAMPAAAIELNAATEVMSLAEIGKFLGGLCAEGPNE